MARKSTWDGVERRSGKDRRENADRRAESRGMWERRSGHDRRGHKLYSAQIQRETELESRDDEERLGTD